MSAKMTTVQWLEIAIENKLTSDLTSLFEQAKEFEKQLLMHSFMAGKIEGLEEGPMTAQQYYTETYKQ
jgi:hypothetical protein